MLRVALWGGHLGSKLRQISARLGVEASQHPCEGAWNWILPFLLMRPQPRPEADLEPTERP